jgi:hypothetical protein
MKTDRLKGHMLSNAKEIERLRARIDASVKLRNNGPKEKAAWEAACHAFHARYDALAFPGGYSDALDRIVSGDAAAIEAALCFLELRPRFFRSGYMYKDILSKTMRAQLSEAQKSRLLQVQENNEAYRAGSSGGPNQSFKPTPSARLNSRR